MMITFLKILSLYLAIFILLSITFIFLNLWGRYGTHITAFFWLAYCGIPIIILSFITGVHKLRLWAEAKTTAPSIVLVIGHLGPAYAIWCWIEMIKSGNGSGVVFIPAVLWVFLFYGIGTIWCLARVAAVKYDEKYIQNQKNS